MTSLFLRREVYDSPTWLLGPHRGTDIHFLLQRYMPHDSPSSLGRIHHHIRDQNDSVSLFVNLATCQRTASSPGCNHADTESAIAGNWFVISASNGGIRKVAYLSQNSHPSFEEVLVM